MRLLAIYKRLEPSADNQNKNPTRAAIHNDNAKVRRTQNTRRVYTQLTF